MHDYLSTSKRLLEPAKGDFAAYISRLQQQKLQAMRPDDFQEGGSFDAHQLISRQNAKVKQELSKRAAQKRSAAEQALAQSGALGAAQSTAQASGASRPAPKRQTASAASAKSRTPPAYTADPKRRQPRRGGNLWGFFIFLILILIMGGMQYLGLPQQYSAIGVIVFMALLFIVVQASRRSKNKR